MNNIHLIGPRGFGKTTFLHRIHELLHEESVCVDLGTCEGAALLATPVQYLLIDNAQEYEKTICLYLMLVIKLSLQHFPQGDLGVVKERLAIPPFVRPVEAQVMISI